MPQNQTPRQATEAPLGGSSDAPAANQFAYSPAHLLIVLTNHRPGQRSIGLFIFSFWLLVLESGNDLPFNGTLDRSFFLPHLRSAHPLSYLGSGIPALGRWRGSEGIARLLAMKLCADKNSSSLGFYFLR